MTYELLVFCGAPKDDQLQQSGGPYLLGKDVSIVDVSCFPYAASAYWACIDISDMPQLQDPLPRMFDQQLSASYVRLAENEQNIQNLRTCIPCTQVFHLESDYMNPQFKL